VAEESWISLFARRFWWPACLTPPLVLLAVYANSRSRSADEAIQGDVVVGLWLLLLFLAGAVLVIGAAVLRTLSSREKSFLSVLGISPAAAVLLWAYFDSQLGRHSHHSTRGTVASLFLAALWVIIALWLRRAAWPHANEP